MAEVPSPPPTPALQELLVTDAPATRKVLARRRKLQEFYHLEAQKHEASAQPAPVTVDNCLELLDDPQRLAAYLAATPIEEILKLRNAVAHQVSAHDSTKKSIIYDNYHELIQLSHVLGELSSIGGTAGGAGGDGGPPAPGIDELFAHLAEFVSTKVERFSEPFESIVANADSEDAAVRQEPLSSL